MKTKVLVQTITGCLECPSYMFTKRTPETPTDHHCSLGACGFPSDLDGSYDLYNKPMEPGTFADDCPLPDGPQDNRKETT